MTVPHPDLPTVRAFVVDAWATQLATNDFTDNDTFFSLGGDSLKAVKVAKAISRSLGSKVSVRLLFEHQQLGEFCEAVLETLSAADVTPTPTSATIASPLGADDVPVPSDWVGSAHRPLDPDTVFNGFIAANVVYGLDRLGLLEELITAPRESAALCERLGRPGAELLRVAGMLGYIDQSDGVTALTDAGREMYQMRGYFTWSVGGYHDVFRNAADIIAGHRTFGDTVLRDEAMVATGSGQNGAQLMGGILDQVISGVEFEHIADLGSGDGSRLRQIMNARPEVTATGFDISSEATALAAQGFEAAGLKDRAAAVRADVLEVIDGGTTRGSDVDTVLSVFLMHDLLADPKRRPRVLPGLREAFPNARTFILADTMLSPQGNGADRLPIFSAGYELAHALMGVPLHTTSTYEELFAAAGLRSRRVVPFGTPHSWLYVLDAD